MKIFVRVGAGLLSLGVGCANLPAQAVTLSPHTVPSHQQNLIAAADQSALVAENRDLLIKNGDLARKIAAKLGVNLTKEIPTTGTPLEQNQVLILQNQATFKAIAEKVGAVVPELASVEAADIAEKNHKLLLQNKSVVVSIMTKLSIPLAPPPTLTGTFVDKNNTLLKGNAGALGKIAAKLSVT